MTIKAPHASHWFAPTPDGDTPRCDWCGVRIWTAQASVPCPPHHELDGRAGKLTLTPAPRP
jgi:hypothetical protein